jgi:hypothetical protein
MITYADDGKTLNPIEPHQREWALFFIFGLTELGADVEGWEHQVDWVRAVQLRRCMAWFQGRPPSPGLRLGQSES